MDNGIAAAVARVRRMETLYDALLYALDQTPERLGTDETLRKAAEVLSGYASGGDWLNDYELDEQGRLPPGLKRGVLSQDGLYDLLSEPGIEALLADGGEEDDDH